LVITTPNWNSLYGLNRKLIEGVQRMRRREPWPHAYDEWKRPEELAHHLSAHHFRIQSWIGICYLPGFTLSLLPAALQWLLIGAVQAVESRLRLWAARWGYLMAVRAIKADAGGRE
jgi:hypothetical protein